MTSLWSRPWVRAVALLLALVGLAGVLYLLRDALTPFAIAFALAYFLNPLAGRLERTLGKRAWLARRADPRALAVAILVVVSLLVVVGVLAVIVPTLYHQVADAVARLPEWVAHVRARLEPLIHRLDVRFPEQSAEVRAELEERLRAAAPAIAGRVVAAVRAAFSSVLGFVLAVLNLVIVPVFAVYLLYDMNRIMVGLGELVPPRLRPWVFSRAERVGALLSAFVRGQVTVCLILGTFYAIGLSACGVPLGLAVGFLIGFFNLVPFMSGALGLPIGLLLSWVDDGSPGRLLAVAAVFVFGQFVEGNFITPRIVGESLGLHSVVVMLAVLAGGTAFGVPGMVLAVPVIAALSVFWGDIKDAYLASDFYAGIRPGASPGSNPG